MQEGVVLGHIVSNKGIKVEKANVEVIAQLPTPTSIKGVRSFLGHVGFTDNSLKNFQKLQCLLPNYLSRMCPFIFIRSV